MFAYYDIQKYGADFQAHPNLPFVILTDFFGASLSVMFFYFASRWLYRRKDRKLKVKEAGEDKFYEEVARELQEKTLVAGLWTKAFAEAGGDDAKARALYIKYRVAQLAEASRQQLENDRLAKQRQEQQKNAAIEADKRKTRTQLQRFCHAILWLIFILITIGFGLGGLCLIVASFTEGDSADFITEFGGAIFLFVMAFICGIGTKHCYKEMR
jgi:uncharacterized membrane protein